MHPLVLSLLPSFAFSVLSFPRLITANTTSPGLGFYDPTSQGGGWLVYHEGSTVGEPLNIVVSNFSDPEVLTPNGFKDFAVSLNMTPSCIGLGSGTDGVEMANLGDGNGNVNQTTVWRYDFGFPILGACIESLVGGNHMRSYFQNGSLANSGAIFLAASLEQPITYQHDPEYPDGYDHGRDLLTGNATQGTISPITGNVYSTTFVAVRGFLPAHNRTTINHNISIDGLVHVWTVKVQINPSASNYTAHNFTGFNTTASNFKPSTASPLERSANLGLFLGLLGMANGIL